MESSLPSLPAQGLIRLPTILRHFEVSKSTWYQGIKDGLYPKAIRHGRKSFWDAAEIHALLEKISNGQ